MVLDSSGTPIGGSLSAEEGILYAEIDLAHAVEQKQFHDVVGYYNRFDIFSLTVNRAPLRPAQFHGDEQTRGLKPFAGRSNDISLAARYGSGSKPGLGMQPGEAVASNNTRTARSETRGTTGCDFDDLAAQGHSGLLGGCGAEQ